MTDATLRQGGPRPAVRVERRLPDPPGVVWRAITDREQLRRWFPCDVEVEGAEWVVGARITFVFPPDVIEMTLTGKVLSVDPPGLLSYSWGEDILTFELQADGEGTLLALANELEAPHCARNAAGWDDCLDRLCGVTPQRDGWRTHFDAYVEAFSPVLGPQDGPPAGYKGD